MRFSSTLMQHYVAAPIEDEKLVERLEPKKTKGQREQYLEKMTINTKQC
jgi:hypothetical protein